MTDRQRLEGFREPGARASEREEARYVLTPVDMAVCRRSSENAFAARASILSRIVGEVGGRGGGLLTLEIAWYSRSGKEPVVHLAGSAVAPLAVDSVANSRDGRQVQDGALRELKADLTGALADHSPLSWLPVSRARRSQLERSLAADHVARLQFRLPREVDAQLEVYPLRAATVERALRRSSTATVVRVRVLAMPRRRNIPLRPLTSSHTYGRLVPIGAPSRDGRERALSSDAAERWQYLVQVMVESRGEIPHDLLAAIAADIRGTGAGSIGILLGGQAAAVEAEWQLGGVRCDEAASDAGWPADTVLLNLRETACLFVLPSGPDDEDPATTRLTRTPARLPRTGIVVGTVAGTRRPVAIPWADMFRHMFIIGATGSGKSTSELNVILQAVRDPSQPAVIVLDPHGSLVDAIAGRLTPDEIERVMWFDPSDPVAPMTWNPLADCKPTTVDAIVAFAWEQWDPHRTMQAGMGPIAEQMIRAVLTTVMAIPGSTLVDAFELIQDDEKAKRYLPLVKDQPTRGFWRMRSGMTDQQKGEYSNYLTSKWSPFVHDEILRHVVGKTTSTLDIPSVIAEGKILLVSVRKAEAGSETATTLARLIKRFVWREITARGPGGPEQRPVLLAVDEFVEYQSELDETMLQAARKFSTSLVLATQNLASIRPSLLESIAANAATALAYRTGIYDGSSIASMLGDPGLAADLTVLPNFRAVARVPVAGEPLPPVLIDASKPPPGFSSERLAEVRAASRARYGVPIDSAAASPASEAADLNGAADVEEDAAESAATELMDLPATSASIQEVLSAASIAIRLDDDGDVRIVDFRSGRMYVAADDDEIRFWAVVPFRRRASRSSCLELANRINDNLKLVRATVARPDDAPGVLELDWYLPLEPRIQKGVIVAALHRFAAAVTSALKADTRQILVTDQRVPRA
jgi:hypothetical protein